MSTNKQIGSGYVPPQNVEGLPDKPYWDKQLDFVTAGSTGNIIGAENVGAILTDNGYLMQVQAIPCLSGNDCKIKGLLLGGYEVNLAGFLATTKTPTDIDTDTTPNMTPEEQALLFTTSDHAGKPQINPQNVNYRTVQYHYYLGVRTFKPNFTGYIVIMTLI